MSDVAASLTDIANRLDTLEDLILAVLKTQIQGKRVTLAILGHLSTIEQMETTNMASFHDLQQEVTKSNSVMDGAVILLGNLSQMLRDVRDQQNQNPGQGQNPGDPGATSAALDDVIAQLDQRAEALAQALIKNTPSDPNPGPTVPTTGQMNQPVPTGPAPGGTDTPVDPNTAGAATPADNAEGGSGTAPKDAGPF